MTFTYSYDIATTFYDGNFPATAEISLLRRCAQSIATPLENAAIEDENLLLTFADELSPSEKNILDGDQVPAAGLLGRCTDYIKIIVDNEEIEDYDVVSYPPDGFTSVNVMLEVTKVNGEIRLSDDEEISILSMGTVFTNKTHGNFDPTTGQFSFKLMPNKSRGRCFYALLLVGQLLPDRIIMVHSDE